MTTLVAVGAQWGDEGKGKLVDWLAPYADFVVRFHGGNNAGHTLVVDGEQTVLHVVPAGVLDPDTVNLIGPGVVVDPGVLLGELEAGWGFVAVRDGQKIAEFCGPDPKTTSNRAELKAVIKALLWLAPGNSATIVTDSQLSVKILSGTWCAKKNLDLIDEARALMQERQIKFRWVRGS